MVTPPITSLRQTIAQLIQQQKGIRTSRVLTRSFAQLGFDLIDLVDIIMAVEKKFKVTIPDALPLNSVADLVAYIKSRSTGAPGAGF